MMISIQQHDFDPGFEQEQISNKAGTGALVTFTGLVRDENLGDEVTGLYLEHYPGMTEKAVQAILDEAAERWPLQAIKVIHRVGPLYPGDRIVFIGVASAHRKTAFDICEFVMDCLKTRAPFWKKETTVEGDRWVDARASDAVAAKRWGLETW